MLGAASAAGSAAAARPNTLTIQDVLQEGEDVTVRVRSPVKGGDTEQQYYTCLATFTDSKLHVKACELVPTLVGLISDKPGTIVYKFMEDLIKLGHIDKPFKAAPWKLCFVTRDGKLVSLDELRDTVPRG